jgi:hypothetical protein
MIVLPRSLEPLVSQFPASAFGLQSTGQEICLKKVQAVIQARFIRVSEAVCCDLKTNWTRRQHAAFLARSIAFLVSRSKKNAQIPPVGQDVGQNTGVCNFI